MGSITAINWERAHASRMVDAFCTQFGEKAGAYRMLAQHAALPLVLTPELVNYLRNHFLRGQVPWIAEADLLLSDLCHEAGYEQYVMDQMVRSVLINEMRRASALGPQRMAAVARLLIGYIRILARTERPPLAHELQAQQWAAMVYLDDQRQEAVLQIKGAFDRLKESASGNQLELGELDRLTHLAESFGPELGLHSGLLDYAREVGQLVTGSTLRSPAKPAPARPETDPLYELYKQAREDHRLGNVVEAEMTLQIIVEQADDPALRSQARAELEQLRAVRREAVAAATAIARQVRQSQPGNVAAQRIAWQNMLQAEPNNQEAQEELRKLDAQATSAEFRAELAEYRKPLVSRDIREVDKARSQVQRLLEQVKVRAPALAQEAQATLDDLNKLRDDILRASWGATSSEAKGDLETAIEIYKKALRDGFAWIMDDRTGEPIEIGVALARARKELFDYQIGRVKARYDDAMEDLKRGAPDTAVGKLEEAQALLVEVEEGGEEIRKRVTMLLEKARDQKKDKDRANELVLLAEKSEDPTQARTLLLQARQAYPAYPDIDTLIGSRDQLLLRKTINEIAGDLARAASELALHRFGEALKACEQALTRGQNLTVSSEEYRQAQDSAKEMQARITAEQAAHQALQAKLGKVRDALAQQPLPHTPLAARMLKELTPEEARDPEAVELSLRLTLLGEADGVWVEAQRAFHNLQQYATAARLCESLSKDPAYAVRAGALQRRAEARLNTELALAAEERGKIDGDDGAEASWRKVRALRGSLPADDQYLLDDAEAALKEIADQRQRQKALDTDLAAVQQLRLDEKWPAWHSALKVLEEKAPATMRTLLVDERETGAQEWRDGAYKAAERYEFDKQWKAAFDVLDPLFKLGILENDDERYLRARLNYHKDEAVRWEQSDVPEDLDKAVHHRQEALAAAPPPATAERQELTAAIHRRAIRLAQRKATAFGPHEAYKVLLEQISQYHRDLTEDVEIRCYLVDYALEAHEFDGARTAALAMQYFPGYGLHARVWQQLVEAVSLFFSQGGKSLEAWEQGVDAFNQLSRDAMAAAVRQMRASDLAQPPNSRSASRTTVTTAAAAVAAARSQFPDPITSFADLMCDHMHSSLPPPSAALTGEQVLYRIRVYGLILRLKPTDNRAQHGIAILAGRLDQLAVDLTGQSAALRTHGGRGAAAELAEAEALERKLAAMTQALKLVNQTETSHAQKLAFERRTLADYTEARRKAAKGLGDLEAAWRKAVGETWDAGPLESALEEARKAGVGRELEPWEDRIGQSKLLLAELNDAVKKIEDLWKVQRYDEVTAACNDLEGRLSQARMLLREEALKTPSGRPEVYDAFRRQALRGIDPIRAAASDKRTNLAEWKHWQRQFEEVQARVGAAQGAAEELMARNPPHLSKARVQYVELIKQLNASIVLLSKLPPVPLASSPEKLYKAVSDPNLIPELRREIEDVKARLKDIDYQLEQVKKLLAEIRAVMTAGRSLSRPADRQLLRSLIDRVRAIDGDHPEIEPYQKLLDKFAR